MNPYPLEVCDYANGSGEPVGFYSRGHHSHAAFRAAVIHLIHETEGTTESIDLEKDVLITPVQQAYWRSVPPTPGGDVTFVLSHRGVQGAYPVTYLEVDL